MSRLDWERANQRDASRRPPREDPIVAWWIIPARRGARCDECSESVPAGAALAYNHTEQRVLCEICTDRSGINAQPSKRWLAHAASKALEADGRRPRKRRSKKSGRRARQAPRGS